VASEIAHLAQRLGKDGRQIQGHQVLLRFVLT
jgi:hypothetical protein